ncbi:putative phage tail protein [Bacillus cytotoxicus]
MKERDVLVETFLADSMKEYRDSEIFRNLMQISADGVVNEEIEFEDVRAQFDIETATWSILDWEEEFGITSDNNKPLDQRRSVIKSKMRSTGATRLRLIKKVAESFQYGEVAVKQDIPNYTIILTFVGKFGIPPNIDDITLALREIIPTHLDVKYIFTYLTWNELDSYNLTQDQLDELNLTWDELETYRKV